MRIVALARGARIRKDTDRAARFPGPDMLDLRNKP
jgi:hypothetical protein